MGTTLTTPTAPVRYPQHPTLHQQCRACSSSNWWPSSWPSSSPSPSSPRLRRPPLLRPPLGPSFPRGLCLALALAQGLRGSLVGLVAQRLPPRGPLLPLLNTPFSCQTISHYL